jgi:hypothetical protein
MDQDATAGATAGQLPLFANLCWEAANKVFEDGFKRQLSTTSRSIAVPAAASLRLDIVSILSAHDSLTTKISCG